MGAGTSRLPGLTLEEARARFKPSEWTRLLRVFHNISDMRDGKISLRAFREDIIGTYFIPSYIAFRLFKALGAQKVGNRLSITKQDFLRMMALLLRGSREEKLTFVFSMYNESGSGSLGKEEVVTMIKLLQTSTLSQSLVRYGTRVRLANAILRAAGGGNDVSLDAFKSLNGDSRLPALSSWFMKLGETGNCNSVQQSPAAKSNKPSSSQPEIDPSKSLWFRQRTTVDKSAVDAFGERELSALEAQYYSILAASSEGKVTPEGIAERAYPRVAKDLRVLILRGFNDEKSCVSITGFVRGVALCTRKNVEGRVTFLLTTAGESRVPRCTGPEAFDLVDLLQKSARNNRTPVTLQPNSTATTSDNEYSNANANQTALPSRETFLKEWQAMGPNDAKERGKSCKDIIGSKVQEWLEAASGWYFREFSRFAAVGLGVHPGNVFEEKNIIEDLVAEVRKEGPKPGLKVFILSAIWARRWALSTGMDPLCIHIFGRSSSAKKAKANAFVSEREGNSNPKSTPRIDNSHLLEPGSISALRSGLKEGKDYIAVSPRVWAALSNWYGGGPMISRIVLETYSRKVSRRGSRAGSGSHRAREEINKGLEVELYPWKLVCRTVDRSQTVDVVLSRSATLQSLKDKVCEKMDLQKRRARLWSFHIPRGSTFPMPVMLESELTLEAAGLTTQQEIVVEQQGKANRWEGVPEFAEKARKLRESLKKSGKRGSIQSRGRGGGRGRGQGRGRGRGGRRTMMAHTGLYNLGNTCFLNSALQCLAATSALSRYFLFNLHLKELNPSNPLGTAGHLALQYATLVIQLHKSTLEQTATGTGGTPVPPTKVRAVMGKKYPQFASYQQQDAQEFLSLLMDGLHEDLNRVLDKPYHPITDSKGRPDPEVALEHIKGFLLRNRSVIIDLFCGFTKSTLEWEITAPKAEVQREGEEKQESEPPQTNGQKPEVKRYTSVKFEPFTMLSLPLPMRKYLSINLTLVFLNPARAPLRLSAAIPINATVRNVREAISRIPGVGVSENKLFICEVYEGRVYPPQTDWSRYMGDGANNESNGNTSPCTEHDILMAYEVPVFDTEDESIISITKRTSTLQEEGKEGKLEEKLEGKGKSGEVVIAIDTRLDVQDRYGKWYCATVIDWDPDTQIITVTFDGYDSRYDESVHIKSGRVAPLNSRATSMRSAREDLNLPDDVVQVVCMHRRVYAQPKAKQALRGGIRAEIFSLPLVMFLSKGNTVNDLYYAIWRRTWRYAPAPLLPQTAPHQNDIKAPATLNPKAPFCLRLVESKGFACARCPWDAYCIGLPLKESEEKIELDETAHIAIDWDDKYIKEVLNERAMEVMDVHKTRKKALLEQRRHVDIGRCFARFTEREKIKEVYCSQVKLHLPATKKFELYCLPPILVVHLKRLVQGGKIQTFVDFPIHSFDPTAYLTESAKGGSVSVQHCAHEMENKQRKPKAGGSPISPSVPAPGPPGSKSMAMAAPLYDLYAVINHYGGAGGGHYVAFARVGTEKSGTWFRFDDSAVTRIAEEDVVTRNAYVMFYRRRDINQVNWDFLPQRTQELLRRPLSAEEKTLADQAAASAARASWTSNAGCTVS